MRDLVLPEWKVSRMQLVSVEQAAETFGCTAGTIRAWVRSGSITGYRVGPKLLRVDLDEMLDTAAGRSVAS